MENIFFWQNNDIICLYFFSNCDILFSWLNFCEKSNLRWRIVDNLAPCSCAGAVEYSRTLLHHARRKTRPCRTLHPPIANKPHYRGGGKLALGGCSRFFGDLALRHSVGLRLTHALSVVVVCYCTCTRRLQSIFRQTTLFGLACGLHRTHPWERGCFYFKKNNLSRCSFAKIKTRSIANKPHYRGGVS